MTGKTSSRDTLAEIRVLDASMDGNPRLPIIEGEGHAWAVIWPGMGATVRSMNRISLAGGSSTITLRHATEAVYYLISGSARALDPDEGADFELVPGSMVHIEPATAYFFVAGPGGAEMVGGPCPPDPDLYRQRG